MASITTQVATSQLSAYLTAKDYQALESSSSTKVVENLSKAAVEWLLNTLPRCDMCTLHNPNISERRMVHLGKRVFSHPDLPKPIQIAVKVTAQDWVLKDGSASLQGQAKVTKFGEIANGEKGKYVGLESALMPSVDYPGVFDWTDCIRYFRDVLSETAILPEIDIENVEWPFDITCYNKEKIDQAVNTMIAKGFNVTIKPSYLTVKKNDDGKSLVVNQDLVVTIPKGVKIAKNAEEQDHPTYKSELSLNNLLVKRRKISQEPDMVAQEETSAPSEPPTVESFIQKIHDDLNFIAAQDPLVRLYAINIKSLSSENQKTLLEHIKGLGYNATIELPSITQRFVGIINGWHRCYLTQNLTIRLPE